MMQNGQTEPIGDTRRRTMVRREVTFVHSAKYLKEKFAQQSELSSFFVYLKYFYFAQSALFSKAGLFYNNIYKFARHTDNL